MYIYIMYGSVKSNLNINNLLVLAVVQYNIMVTRSCLIELYRL